VKELQQPVEAVVGWKSANASTVSPQEYGVCTLLILPAKSRYRLSRDRRGHADRWGMRISRSFIVFLIALLSACSIHQTPLEDVNDQMDAEIQSRWEAHRDSVSAISGWKVKGKIAVKAGSKGGHASLRWDREEQIQHIELYGPLGGGRVVIDEDENGARLKDTKGGDSRGESVAKLIEERLGWPLPFDQLPAWLRGLPAKPGAKMEWDDHGQVVRMNDSGWQVSYPAYQTVFVVDGQQAQVPRQIELNALPGTLRVYDKKGEYLGEDFFIRLIIKSWLP
jgi:outer membrane lipoprotein LolB